MSKEIMFENRDLPSWNKWYLYNFHIQSLIFKYPLQHEKWEPGLINICLNVNIPIT